MLKIYVTSRISVGIGFYSFRRLSKYRRMTFIEAELWHRMEQCMAKWEKNRVHRRT